MHRPHDHSLPKIALILALLVTRPIAAEAQDPAVSAPADQEQSQTIDIGEWFSRYDQIRRDAELTLGEKLQCRGLLERGLSGEIKPGGRSAALVEKMIAKYGAAASRMQALPTVLQTSELQSGYAQYFSQVHQLFQDCLKSPEASDGAGQALPVRRKELEELDKKNKSLDEVLRKEFSIPRHKHI